MKKKRILIGVAFIIFTLLFTACGNSKYKLESGSKLTKDNMKILRKNYNDLDENQKTELIVMQGRMTDKEFIKFKDDLKRLYVQQTEKDYGSKESAEKMFEEDFNYELRKKQGKLTKAEEENEKEIDKQAQANWDQAGKEIEEENKYKEAEEKIKNYFDNFVKYKEYNVKCELIEVNSKQHQIDVCLDVVTLKDITVGQMIAIRNEMAMNIEKIIKTKIKVNVKLNGEDKGTCIFNNGWSGEIHL